MRDQLRDYAKYTGLGLQLVFPIGLGCLVGYHLDGEYGTTPWLLVLGAVLGIGVGFATFFTTVLRFEKRNDHDQT